MSTYACTAMTEFGARCRHSAEPHGKWMCTQHNAMVAEGKEVARVGLSDSVDFKGNVNQNWVKRLEAAGVETRDQDFAAKDATHEQQAKDIGREFHRYRDDIGDSGVPVFGFDEEAKKVINIEDVSIYEAFMDLVAKYELVDVYMHKMREGKNQFMRKLVVYFGHGEPRVGNAEAVQATLEYLAGECWDCVVWSNPRNKHTGKRKDTVNFFHRKPGVKPALTLRLEGGLWSTKPLVAPVQAAE